MFESPSWSVPMKMEQIFYSEVANRQFTNYIQLRHDLFGPQSVDPAGSYNQLKILKTWEISYKDLDFWLLKMWKT